jgi:hypothetical protein
MADKKAQYQEMLDDIEAKRKAGKSVVPPSRLQFGNLLGGKTRAFNDAVKIQGNRSTGGKKPSAGSNTDDIYESQSTLRTLVDRAKKAKGQQVR